MLKIII